MSPATESERSPPKIPDHEMLRRIGRGSYGEVWLARNVMGVYRAVKVIYRDRFESTCSGQPRMDANGRELGLQGQFLVFHSRAFAVKPPE